MRQLFVHNNIPHEKKEQWPTFPYSHPEGSLICHSMLSGECMPSAQNYGLCERNHCETAFCTYASIWYEGKSLNNRNFIIKCMEKYAQRKIVFRDTKWLLSNIPYRGRDDRAV